MQYQLIRETKKKAILDIDQIKHIIINHFTNGDFLRPKVEIQINTFEGTMSAIVTDNIIDKKEEDIEL